MILLTENDYKNLARNLISAIDESNYFNGSVDHATEEFDSRLTASLLVYREALLAPDDPTRNCTRITDIVPVWWEYHLVLPSGEALTDFCWREFKKYLL